MTIAWGTPRIADQTSVLQPISSNLTPPVTFGVWIDGSLAYSVESADGTVEIRLPLDEQVDVEVTDVDGAIPPFGAAARFTLTWLSVAGATQYRIDRYDFGDSTWTEQQPSPVPAQGQRAFRWQSPRLEDGEVHRFRIVPMDAAGNSGDALEFTGRMVRKPDLPRFTATVDDTGELTIDEV